MTDDTDDPTKDELENRVEQLEQTVQQMLPSRRDALKLGGTALAAGALGSAATGSASAGTNSVGTIGSSGSPIDIEVEDINPSGTRAATLGANLDAGQNNVQNVGTLSTEQLHSTDPVNPNAAEGFEELTFSSGGYANRVARKTGSVGTSAAEILTAFHFALVLVSGHDINDNTIRFADLVLHGFRQSPIVIQSQERNTPASRTFSVSGSSLELAMGSGSYDVICHANTTSADG